MKPSLQLFFASILALGLSVAESRAALVGPSYPAPGNNTFASSGVSPADGVRTWSYSGFDNSAFSQLYWGPNSASAVFSRLSGSGPGSTMTFLGISGNVASWSGTAYYLNNLQQSATAPTLFRATVNSGATPWVLASTLGLSGIGAVVDNSSGLNFSVNLEFLVWTGASYIPLNTFENLYDSGIALPPSSSSFSAGFYSAATAVPEPSTYIAGALLVLPFGLQALRFVRSRRQTV